MNFPNRGSRRSRRWLAGLALVGAMSLTGARSYAADQAMASISDTQLNTSEWQYSITLNNTGTNPLGTFWFAWVPGQDYLSTNPISVISPTNWTDNITHGGSGDGYAIQWLAGSNTLAAGSSLSGFSFDSADPPSSVFGNSAFFSHPPVGTSFVYSGAPFSDGGFELVASAVPEPATVGLILLGAPAMLLRRRRQM
jgi:hypothetical protein